MDKIKELINLLLADFEIENEEEILANFKLVVENPDKYILENDASWITDLGPESLIQFALYNEIGEFMITGDKIDEIHEVIVDELEGDFPPYPYEKKLNATDYIEWVSQQLDQEYPDLELIEIGDSFGDNIQLMLVYKEDVSRIKALCEELGIRCNRAAEILKF
jgi:hypothetical protein